MLGAFTRRIFGSANDRRVKGYRRRAQAVAAMEPRMASLGDDGLRDLTGSFRSDLAAGTPLDDLLVPAFAAVREAARRALGQRHFDVQLVGGMALHDGAIAEMRTGEGKTLVATLSAYLNALPGKGVHVVTVNDYLAARDAAAMGPVFAALGMSVGVVVAGMDDDARRAAYACDVTYGTNSEVGFDYLRDNMKFSRDTQVQRGHAYALVDEVDSILIDEARTPLVVSGMTEGRAALYGAVDAVVRRLGRGHYDLDERHRTATLNDGGIEMSERWLREAGLLKEDAGLFDTAAADVLHHLHQALRANAVFRRDRDYVVRDGEVVIVDESTGRAMPGRRYADGLHQAIEAKEGVEIQAETVTLASVTYQNLFRSYAKLSGMTGTAGTEADEFAEIYGLDVVEIPTNLPVARVDEDDEVYRTVAEKYAAVIAAVGRAHERGQPVLVGTSSVEQSEALARLMVEAGYVELDFTASGIPSGPAAGSRRFAVLNARAHGREADIIAEAGAPGAITIATNMAGRGTDIKLGGNVELRVARELADVPPGPARDAAIAAIEAEVAAAREAVLASGEPADPSKGRPSDLPGGLFVIGSERHESRRIDNQLRGRSGRQGDPGRSRFYLSVEDDLVRVFGASERVSRMLDDLGVGEGEAIVHPIVNKLVGKAQAKVEAHNFNQRKDVLKYDDVVNAQRKAVFSQRGEVMDLDAAGIREIVDEMRAGAVDDLVDRHLPPEALAEDWDVAGLKTGCADILGFSGDFEVWQAEEGVDREVVRERLSGIADEFYAQVTAANGPEVTVQAERQLLLQVMDGSWRGHIETLEHLRQGIGLRGIGQRNPIQEFTAEAYELFKDLQGRVRRDVTANVCRVRAARQAEAA